MLGLVCSENKDGGMPGIPRCVVWRQEAPPQKAIEVVSGEETYTTRESRQEKEHSPRRLQIQRCEGLMEYNGTLE